MLGPILKMWGQLYKKDNFSSVKIKPGQLNSEDPVDSFIFMEAQNTMMVLSKVHSSLGSIAKVLKGTGMLTPLIEEEGKKLL